MQKIPLKILDSIIFHYSVRRTNDSNNYLLIIPGWQSSKEIFSEVINKLSLNVITFDYPGIGDNSWNDSISKELFNKNERIMEEVLQILQNKYSITAIWGTSAGSTFVATHPYTIKNLNTKIILSSPQFFLSSNDIILNNIFKILLKAEIVSGLDIFHKIININYIRNTWIKVVARKYRRLETYKFQIIGINLSKKYWTLKQFIDLVKQKREMQDQILFTLTNYPTTLFIGKEDNLISKKQLVSYLKMIEKQSGKKIEIVWADSNHVVETEAVEDLVNTINNIYSKSVKACL